MKQLMSHIVTRPNGIKTIPNLNLHLMCVLIN